MKLNYDCVRDVLITLEENLEFGKSCPMMHLCSLLDNYDSKEVEYACLKLAETQYLRVMYGKKGPFPEIINITDITYEGHEFLNTIRPEEVYEQAQQKIKSQIGSVSLEVFKTVASSIALKFLGI